MQQPSGSSEEELLGEIVEVKQINVEIIARLEKDSLKELFMKCFVENLKVVRRRNWRNEAKRTLCSKGPKIMPDLQSGYFKEEI